MPGSSPTYPETLTDIKVVPDKFKSNEIDGSRILVSDLKWIVFPETGAPVPQPNDIIRIESSQDSRVGDYRVVMNDTIYAGDTLALSQLQVRFGE